jgi:hypothetical protein
MALLIETEVVVLTFVGLFIATLVMIFFLFRRPPRPAGGDGRTVQEGGYPQGSGGVEQQAQPVWGQPVQPQYGFAPQRQ